MYLNERDYGFLESDFCVEARDAFRSNPRAVLSIDGCKSTMVKSLIDGEHRLRWRLVHRNSDVFINQSFELPPLRRHTVHCSLPLQMRMVNDLLTPDLNAMLNANDIAGVYAALGVEPMHRDNIVDAVTQHFKRELSNAQKKLEFKATLEYATTESKGTALDKLNVEIRRLNTRIATLTERVNTYKADMCPICMCEFTMPSMMRCCGAVLCLECLQGNLRHRQTCPLCRAVVTDVKTSVQFLTALEDVPAAIPASSMVTEDSEDHTKLDAFLKICHDNPTGRILVFSDYDTTFGPMRDLCVKNGIRWNVLAGNGEVVAHMVREYEAGKLQVLFLNAQHRGAGINLTSTTHVVVYHSMNMATERQVIGRAYRMGRTAPLDVYYLCNPGETATME